MTLRLQTISDKKNLYGLKFNKKGVESFLSTPFFFVEISPFLRFERAVAGKCWGLGLGLGWMVVWWWGEVMGVSGAKKLYGGRGLCGDR